jgi:hypothetical protein
LLDEESRTLPKLLGGGTFAAAECPELISSLRFALLGQSSVKLCKGNAFLICWLSNNRQTLSDHQLGQLRKRRCSLNRKIAVYLGKVGVDTMNMKTTLNALRKASRDGTQVLIAFPLGVVGPSCCCQSKSFEYVMGLSSVDAQMMRSSARSYHSGNQRAGMVSVFDPPNSGCWG